MSDRITICIPSGDMVHADFARALAMLTYREAAAKAPLSLAWVKGSLVVVNRNEGVKLAQQDGATHIMFLDSDMVFPPDTIRRLLARDKDIVGATYCQRVPPYAPLGRPLGGEALTVESGCVEVEIVPTGCLLVRMGVFEKLARPWFQTPAVTDPETGEPVIRGEDCYFCDEARKAGFSVWMDIDLSWDLCHIGQDTIRIVRNAA